MESPYASPKTESSAALTRDEAVRLRTHQKRIEWLGLWNCICGVSGLLLTLSVVALAQDEGLGYILGSLLWLAFWTARTAAGAGMFELKGWSRWLGIGVHALLTLSGVSIVVGVFGLWTLLSERGGLALERRGALPPDIRPAHSPGLVLLLAALVLVNWAVPLWFLVFVLGPMV